MPQSPKMTKLSADQMRKLAEVDRFDSEQAYELGFAKCAKDLGLSEQEFQRFYEIGCQKLSQNA